MSGPIRPEPDNDWLKVLERYSKKAAAADVTRTPPPQPVSLTPPPTIRPEPDNDWLKVLERHSKKAAAADVTRTPPPQPVNLTPQPTIRARTYTDERLNKPAPRKPAKREPKTGIEEALYSAIFESRPGDILDFVPGLGELRAIAQSSSPEEAAAAGGLALLPFIGDLPFLRSRGARLAKESLEAIGGRMPKAGERFAVLTPENPGGLELAPELNAKRHESFRRELERRGYQYVPVTGRYQDPETGAVLTENSYLIFNIPEREAKLLGRRYGQNGIVTQKGYHDLVNDRLHPSRGVGPTNDIPYTELPGGQRFAVDIDWKTALAPNIGRLPVPKNANPEAMRVVEEYLGNMGFMGGRLRRVPKVDPEKGRVMAQVFEQLQSDPNNPAVRRAYEAMAREVDAQFQAIQDAGYRIEFVDEDPYKNSKEMMEDLRKNRRLKVLKTNQASRHPLLTNEQQDKFRAVHDFFGHASEGNQFGPVGEERAYRLHSPTFSPLARQAMATETRGQNSWVNFGPNAHLPPAERPFAEQKAALWPTALLGEYEDMPNMVFGEYLARTAPAESVGPIKFPSLFPENVFDDAVVDAANAEYKARTGRDWPGSVRADTALVPGSIEWLRANAEEFRKAYDDTEGLEVIPETEVMSGLPSSEPLPVKIRRRKDKNGMTTFTAYFEGEPVGELVTADGYVVNAEVREGFRRQKVATQLYDAAEKHFGFILPGDEQTDEARAFWRARKRGGQADAPNVRADTAVVPLARRVSTEVHGPGWLEGYTTHIYDTPNGQVEVLLKNPDKDGTVRIENIQNLGTERGTGANTIGAGSMRAIVRDIVESTGAKRITAERVSGANPDREIQKTVRSAVRADTAVVAPIEKISAAAIRTPDGRVVQGVNHEDAFRKATGMEVEDAPDDLLSTWLKNEGFVTDAGRFVDRQEARAIARSARQVANDRPGRLTAEELVEPGTGRDFSAGRPPAAPAVRADTAVVAPLSGRASRLESAADDLFRNAPEPDPDMGTAGDELGVCTTGACAIAKQYKGQVVGFSRAKNPAAKIAPYDDGHDFAIIDGRYLVDPWAKHVEGSVKRATLDLADPNDAAIARELYGDPATWEVVEDHRPKTARKGRAATGPVALAPSAKIGVARETPAPNIQIPPQEDLPRPQPVRIEPEQLEEAEELAFKALTSRGMDKQIAEAAKRPGGADWYLTNEVARRAMDALGEGGQAEANRLYDFVAASTARTSPAQNLKLASWWRAMADAGLLDIDELLLGKKGPQLTPPPGFGHFAQRTTHAPAVGRLLQQGKIDPIANPKPASFSANLGLNWRPATVDKVATDWFTETEPRLAPFFDSDAPRKWAYPAIERAFQRAGERARKKGLLEIPDELAATAPFQAAHWMATRRNRPHEGSFSSIFDQLLSESASLWGVTPGRANELFWRDRQPLLLPLGAPLLVR